MKIPRVIHQTWKTRDLPPTFQRYQKSWIDCHPNWEYRFYDDHACRQLLIRLLPQICWIPPTRPGYPNCFPFNLHMYAKHHFAGTWKKTRRRSEGHLTIHAGGQPCSSDRGFTKTMGSRWDVREIPPRQFGKRTFSDCSGAFYEEGWIESLMILPSSSFTIRSARAYQASSWVITMMVLPSAFMAGRMLW